jgi:hypothetical protein
MPIEGVGACDGAILGSCDPVEGAWLGSVVVSGSRSSKLSPGKLGESNEDVVGAAVVTMLGRAEGDSSTGNVGTVLSEPEVATGVGIELGAALATMLGREEGGLSSSNVGTVLGESEVATRVGTKLGMSDGCPVSSLRPNTDVGTMEGKSEGEAAMSATGASVKNSMGSTRVGAPERGGDSDGVLVGVV